VYSCIVPVHDFVIAKCKSIAKLQLSSGLLLTQFVAAKNACIDAVELKLVVLFCLRHKEAQRFL